MWYAAIFYVACVSKTFFAPSKPHFLLSEAFCEASLMRFVSCAMKLLFYKTARTAECQTKQNFLYHYCRKHFPYQRARASRGFSSPWDEKVQSYESNCTNGDTAHAMKASYSSIQYQYPWSIHTYVKENFLLLMFSYLWRERETFLSFSSGAENKYKDTVGVLRHYVSNSRKKGCQYFVLYFVVLYCVVWHIFLSENQK